MCSVLIRVHAWASWCTHALFSVALISMVLVLAADIPWVFSLVFLWPLRRCESWRRRWGSRCPWKWGGLSPAPSGRPLGRPLTPSSRTSCEPEKPIAVLAATAASLKSAVNSFLNLYNYSKLRKCTKSRVVTAMYYTDDNTICINYSPCTQS